MSKIKKAKQCKHEWRVITNANGVSTTDKFYCIKCLKIEYK